MIGPCSGGHNYVIGVCAGSMVKPDVLDVTHAVCSGSVGDGVSVMIDLQALRQ